MTNVFIIVGFCDGIGHTLQLGGILAWCFRRKVKSYKSLDRAKKMAQRVNCKWLCENVIVYEVPEGETFSSSSFKRWDDRIRYEIRNNRSLRQKLYISYDPTIRSRGKISSIYVRKDKTTNGKRQLETKKGE